MYLHVASTTFNINGNCHQTYYAYGTMKFLACILNFRGTFGMPLLLKTFN